MKDNHISGVPVVERSAGSQPGKLFGILTNRDVRFATDPRQPVSELMTKKLITVREGVGQDEAKRFSPSEIASRSYWSSMRSIAAVGLITVKDIEKAVRESERLQG